MAKNKRGESPAHKGTHDAVGEGAGHEVKRHKGSGYARSTHMKGDVGPVLKGHVHKYMEPRSDTKMAHTGYHKTAEKKLNHSSHKLPMEKHVPIKGSSLPTGDHFESEIKEHFPGKKGVAGIHNVGMPQSNPTTPSESVSNSHGHVSGKAEHHPRMGDAHKFRQPFANMSHGYGHDHEKRAGPLRLSGHRNAHRIGKR
jgi:hypothetical protein